MDYGIGSLVKVRGREWVVLPESRPEENLLMLRPLAGSLDEITGIYLPLEEVESAQFALPDPSREIGNHRSCTLLRQAVRLGFRSATGPFRSLAAIGVEPRPYQLVPLLMALSQDPVRLLIADDVGVGKTIEACLIARELLDRGEIDRLAVLAPPHLVEQWQRVLRRQFHIEAAAILPSTAGRLERQAGLSSHQSLLEYYPHVVISLDYIKAERRRNEFLRTCPELIIVDEAHACASTDNQQRHALLQKLSEDEQRHVILVTATPHSGKQETFRSLLTLLKPEFSELPDDLSGETNRKHREHLARHLIQRRRGDILHYCQTKTEFPRREASELIYKLTNEQHELFARLVNFARQHIASEDLKTRGGRLRWWSVLGLMRALGSSPDAAIATINNRTGAEQKLTVEEIDEAQSKTVLDLDDVGLEGLDLTPSCQVDEDNAFLNSLAADIKKSIKKADPKFLALQSEIKKLLDEGFSPIIFCRFIPTVSYLAAYLRKSLGAKVMVEALDGTLPPEDREARVEALDSLEKRVLVCTDCLSEGINLQQYFDAVIHYDLSWNPTRHEQREGRADRFGQRSPVVKTLTMYGKNNPVDGIVLQVLLRKHQAIKQATGVAVPVPADIASINQAMFESLVLRQKQPNQNQLDLDFGDFAEEQNKLHQKWDFQANREKINRTIFAQHGIKIEEISEALTESHQALGTSSDVENFMREALPQLDIPVVEKGKNILEINLKSSPTLREALSLPEKVTKLKASFDTTLHKKIELLDRAHPLVSFAAEEIWQRAMDVSTPDTAARRCGVIRTKAVSLRTALLLLRLRFSMQIRDRRGSERPLLAEEAMLLAWRGSADDADFLDEDEINHLLAAKPEANVPSFAATEHLQKIIASLPSLHDRITKIARDQAKQLLAAHRRVRKAAAQRHSPRTAGALDVKPHLPVDILGIYVYLPLTQGGAA